MKKMQVTFLLIWSFFNKLIHLQGTGLSGLTFKCQNIEKWSSLEPSVVNQKDTLQETALCPGDEVTCISIHMICNATACPLYRSLLASGLEHQPNNQKVNRR